MKKAELVAKIAEQAGITKKAAEAALGAVIGAICDSLKMKDGSVRIADLGTFKVSHRKARAGVNPQTGKKIKIPATNVPRFTASKALREAVKKSK
jgi:nucleoid DNA-binding protein